MVHFLIRKWYTFKLVYTYTSYPEIQDEPYFLHNIISEFDY